MTTQIAASAPLLGQYMSRLLGGESAVGVVTFARFYGMHVLLLPPATTLLIALHVYLENPIAQRLAAALRPVLASSVRKRGELNPAASVR